MKPRRHVAALPEQAVDGELHHVALDRRAAPGVGRRHLHEGQLLADCEHCAHRPQVVATDTHTQILHNRYSELNHYMYL